MADSFDPYRKWLAIPAEEQPPHYYRLLAIPPFESDPDVISNAADGRMSQIKSYQTGPYAKLSQQILNQIAAAKVCLLNPQKKAAYDRSLQEKLQPAAQPAEFDLASLSTRSSPRTVPRPKKSKSWLLPVIAGGALILAGSAAAVVFMSLPSGDRLESKKEKPPLSDHGGGKEDVAKKPSPPTPLPEGEGIKKPSPSGRLPVAGEANPAKPVDADRAKGADSANPAPDTSVASKDDHDDVSMVPAANHEDPSGNPRTVANPSPAAVTASLADSKSKPEPQVDEKPTAGPKKLPVPSDDEQKKAEGEVQEIFKRDFASAKSAETRSALAGKLVEEAGKASNDAAAQYVLCKLAAVEYAAAGNADKAMEIVDTTASRYETDVSRLKAEVLAAVLSDRGKPVALEPEIARGICDTAMKLAEAPAAAGEVEAAGQFARVATTAANRTKDPQLIREAGNRSREIDRLKQRFAAVQKALDALKADPDDADANLKVGQWYCFVTGQWNEGLPRLAKGSSVLLADLAKQDLAAPGDAKQEIALADAWWNLAEKEPTANKAAIQGRARHWYEQAVEKTTGLDKTRIQKRLEEAAAPEHLSKPVGREVAVDVTDLPFVGKTVVVGEGNQQHNIVVDSLDLWKGFRLSQPAIPDTKVRHFFFLHATSYLEINLEPRLKGGQLAKRFKAYLYLDPTARPGGSDGIVWTVEAGTKGRMKGLLTTVQSQDMNPVDLVLPPGTTRIVIRSLPGAKNNDIRDWGVMANPVVVFRK